MGRAAPGGATLNGVRAAVSGGPGFLGSHLSRELLSPSVEVVAVDDLGPGRDLFGVLGHLAVTFVRHDVGAPFDVDGLVDFVFNRVAIA